MIKFSKKGWLILIPAFIFSAGFIFLAPSAKALGIASIANEAIASVFGFIQGLILQFIGNTLAAVANALGWFLKSQGSYFKDIAIVQTSWTVFRDFANMFFILILVIIAFATIFDIQNYNWKGLIAKFLVAALLINFSLVIGQFIINISTTLSNIMLNQFSDITANLAGGLGLNKLITATTKPMDAEKAVVAAIVSTAGTLIVATIALLSMLAAFIFSVVRVPVLWALLIISPLAWISSILPATRALHQWWWKQFLGWVFFMPLYLFALMMGVSILVNRPDLDAAVKMSAGQTALSRAGNLFGFAAQDIFFYILTIIILVCGLGLSLKASFLTGTGATKIFGGISGGINNYVKRKTGLTGAQATWERVKQEGLPEKWGTVSKLYTGTRGAQKETAKWEQRLSRGLGYTPDLKQQKQQVAEIDAEIGRLRDLEAAGELKVDSAFAAEAYQIDRNSTRGAAMRMLLYEKGMVDGTEFQKDQLAWTESNPFLAQASSEKAAKGKYKRLSPGQLINMAKAEGTFAVFKTDAATSTRKKWYNFIQNSAKHLADPDFNSTAFLNGLEIYGGGEAVEGGDFIDNVGKIRPDIVADYKMTLPVPAGGSTLTRREQMQKLLKNTEDISQIPLHVWTSDPDFIPALTERVTPSRARGRPNRDFRNKLEEAIKDKNFGSDRTSKLALLAAIP